MSEAYIKQLEEQNEELQQRLAHYETAYTPEAILLHKDPHASQEVKNFWLQYRCIDSKKRYDKRFYPAILELYHLHKRSKLLSAKIKTILKEFEEKT